MRRCGICGKAPREGEEMRCVRLTPDQSARIAQDLQLPQEPEPGLYHCIPEVFETVRGYVAAERGVPVESIPYLDLV